MHIRQIALVAEDLEPAVEDLRSVLGLGEGFVDEGVGTFGLHNSVMPVGDTFLEVVSPVREGTTAGRLLRKRGGDGGYMVILQSTDLDADRKRLDALGVRVVWEIALDDISTVHLHPRDVGGAIVSIDVPVPPGAWRWGGPDWEARSRTDTTLRITGAEIQCADPAAMARRWSEVIDHPAVDAGDGTYEIPLDEGRLRFVPDTDGRGEGVAAVEVQVRDRQRVLRVATERGLEVGGDAFTACGTRFRLVE